MKKEKPTSPLASTPYLKKKITPAEIVIFLLIVDIAVHIILEKA